MFLYCYYVSATQIFTSSTLLNYLRELTDLLLNLPSYQDINKLYNGGKNDFFHSPDCDYYKLRYLKRYRFPPVRPKEKCECDTCEVSVYRIQNYSIETG